MDNRTYPYCGSCLFALMNQKQTDRNANEKAWKTYRELCALSGKTCPSFEEKLRAGETPDTSDTHRLIRETCSSIADFLIGKNKAYGNSALNPIRVFSKADPLEQINVRIDDKLNRMLQGTQYPGDNDEQDLIGYLILKQVAKKLGKEKPEQNTEEPD